MDRKQYNNIINHSLKAEKPDTSLSAARGIFKNLGVALPRGDLKAVCETVKTDDYMGWRSCSMEEAQAAANIGTAAMGVSSDRIVVIAGVDSDEPAAENSAVMTITDTTPALAVSGLQFYAYSYAACGSCGGDSCGSGSGGSFDDQYTEELIYTFGFSRRVAMLIRMLYAKVEVVYSYKSKIEQAWLCARLLGDIVYRDAVKTVIEWELVAGDITHNYEYYFIDRLKFTTCECDELRLAVKTQHNRAIFPDFAHMQISLAARLAYYLGIHGIQNSIYKVVGDEKISYFAGWLGDATIIKDGKVSFGDDDYCADLDAENVYRILITGKGSIEAFNSYYKKLTRCHTRADEFLGHISYSFIEENVFYELIDKHLNASMVEASNRQDVEMTKYYYDLMNNEQYHWDYIKSNMSDTYDFLKSINARLAHIKHFA